MSSSTSEMPEDSVLRRHWLAAREMQSPAATAPSSTSTAQNTSGGGLFGWLKSLFS